MIPVFTWDVDFFILYTGYIGVTAWDENRALHWLRLLEDHLAAWTDETAKSESGGYGNTLYHSSYVFYLATANSLTFYRTISSR